MEMPLQEIYMYQNFRELVSIGKLKTQ